jgi:diacylglycerol kinase (ATP)
LSFKEGKRLAIAVVNPHTRLGLRRVQQLLSDYRTPGLDLVTLEMSPGRDLKDHIAPYLDDAAVAIAIGGDGTVSSLGATLLDQDIPLGIVPGGSTNMIAKVSGVPMDPQRALRLIFGPHHRQRVDAGRVGDRALMHIGGTGFDARLFERADPELKRRFGWVGYIPAALPSIRSPVSTVTVRVDESTVIVPSRLVLVANGAELISSRFPLVPGVVRADGEFDVLIFTATTPLEMARVGLRFATRSLLSSTFVVHLRGSVISLSADPPMPVEIDGEPIGSTPVEIEVEHLALELITGRP